MSNAPHYNIDVPAFWTDPYPDLARMRKEAPIAFVPQLNSTSSPAATISSRRRSASICFPRTSRAG
jgi:hypothetical protein